MKNRKNKNTHAFVRYEELSFRGKQFAQDCMGILQQDWKMKADPLSAFQAHCP